jgi:hypothetical protein
MGIVVIFPYMLKANVHHGNNQKPASFWYEELIKGNNMLATAHQRNLLQKSLRGSNR